MSKARLYAIICTTFAALTCLSIALWSTHRSSFFIKQAQQQALEETSKNLDQAARDLHGYMDTIRQGAEKLAQQLALNIPSSTQELDQDIATIIKQHDSIQFIQVAFQPAAFNNQPQYGRITTKSNNKIQTTTITYNYAASTNADRNNSGYWYGEGLRKTSCWLDPLLNETLNVPTISFSVAFFATQDKQKIHPLGVVSAGTTAPQLRQFVNSLPTSRDVFMMITSTKGVLVTYPDDEKVYAGNTLMDIAKEQKNKSLQKQLPLILSRPNSNFIYTGTENRGEAALSYRNLQQDQLVLIAILFLKDMVGTFKDVLHKQSLITIIAGIFALLCALAMLLLWHSYSTKIIRTLTTAAGLSLIIGIGLLWHNEQRFSAKLAEHFNVITNQSSINSEIKKFKDTETTAPTWSIKTGISLNSIYYITNNNLQITGYIWQRYPANFPRAIPRDFVLPHCYKLYTKEQIIHNKNKDEELIAWRFSGKFNQGNTTLTKFPFDDQNIKLTIDHPSLNEAILVVPDIPAYYSFVPNHLPGLSVDVELEGRFATASYFAFRDVSKEINLHLNYTDNTPKKPILYFLIVAGRNLQDIILVYLIPILLALLSLHTCLALMSNDVNKMDRISLVSALFLAITLLHSSMRTSIEAENEICYLEYGYLLLYIACCFVILYTLFYGYKWRIMQRLSAHNNFWTTMIFVPTYLFAAFIITMWVFY